MTMAMDEAPIIYGLEDFQTRALVAQAAETEKINFIVGTQSLNAINQVQVIEYDDDSGLVSKQCYDHPAGEIWRLSSAPQTPDLIASVYNTNDRQVSEAACAVWRLPKATNSAPSLEEHRDNVEQVCVLHEPATDSAACTGVRWVGWSGDSDTKLATLTHGSMQMWHLTPDGTAKVVCRGAVGGSGAQQQQRVGGLGVGRWYPHQGGQQIAATLGPAVMAWDTRTSCTAWTIPAAHLHTVRELDFNPNLQYHVATCGDDCATKFWDLRMPDKPLLALKHHSHWVWSVRYNASYDQLLLSCSSDQRVVLSNLPSVAAMPFGDTQEDRSSNVNIAEGVLQTYEEHEDSVYAVEWSAGDFWTFASLSYDGRLVINKVPRVVKYKQFM